MNVPALAQNGGEGASLVHMIERVARDPAIDLSRLEKLMEMHERVVLRNAEVNFNGAMAAAQAEIERVAPDKENTQTRGSKYASYAAMDGIIRPVYSRLGFALSFGTEDCPTEGCIRIVCDVSNVGHVKRYHIDMPADGKGARGNDVMTRTHATASAVTYGRRYLLGMIFNVVIGLPDDDGNAAGVRPTTARARNAEIAKLPEDQRHEATERAIDEWSDRQAGNLRNAMRKPPDEAPAHDADGVVWEDSGERPATAEDFEETESERIFRLDGILAEAAKRGMKGLEAAWRESVKNGDRAHLKAALDRRHKLVAAAKDAEDASLDIPEQFKRAPVNTGK